MREVHCPNCSKPVAWTPESPWRPFCSERCRLIDLGQWFSEEHAIPGEDGETDRLFVPDANSKPS
jgi:uncharacterized protein